MQLGVLIFISVPLYLAARQATSMMRLRCPRVTVSTMRVTARK
ncbi:MAG: hypothetical protein RR022_09040 [Angelakisella sp.]